jgi:integrase
MKITDKELHEYCLALKLIRPLKLSLLDVVTEQVELEKRRQKMAEVSSAVELFLKDKADMGNAATSMRTLRSIILRFAKVFDGRLLDEVTHSEIKEWVKSMGLATRTKNGYVKEVKNLYNWSIQEGYAEINPTVRIAAYRPSVDELEAKEEAKEILTVSEVDTMTKYVMDNCPDAMPRMAIQLYGGTRPERESASIEMDNIYMDDGLLHVPASKAKDRKERFVKMSDKLMGIVRWAKENNLSLQARDWNNKWSAVKNSVGLLGQWPNSCTRHTFASYNLAKFGAEPTKEALGHGSYDMLFQHYRTLVRPAEAETYFAA